MSSLVLLARETEEARRRLSNAVRKWLRSRPGTAVRPDGNAAVVYVTELLVEDLADLLLSSRADEAEIVRTEERQRAAESMRDAGSGRAADDRLRPHEPVPLRRQGRRGR